MSFVNDRAAFALHEVPPAAHRQSRDLSPVDHMKNVYGDRSAPYGHQLDGQVNTSYTVAHDDTFMSSASNTGRVTPSVLSTGRGSHHSSLCILNPSDGSTIVMTPPREHRELEEKPVSAKVVRYTRYFSIMSIFLFPPSGFAALYFALKAARNFDDGIDMVAVKRYVKYAERLVILSIVLGILMYTLIFAGIGRAAYGNKSSEEGRATPV